MGTSSKHVVVQVGESEFRSAIENVLRQRDDLEPYLASSKQDAVDHLRPGSVVLTDLSGGGASAKPIHAQPATAAYGVPVIVLTSATNERLAVQALREGAASYVPGKLVESELSSTLDSVFAVASERRDRSRIMDCIAAWDTEFVLENDRHLISPLVRYLQESTQRMGLFDQNEETRLGIALEEALVNSMYHGNLEVASALREEDERAFYAQIESRRFQEPYVSRKLRVRAQFSRDEALFAIADEGPGFDVSKVPDPTDPANVERVCGRGLLLMRTFMDQVEFNEQGNQVRLIKRRPGS